MTLRSSRVRLPAVDKKVDSGVAAGAWVVETWPLSCTLVFVELLIVLPLTVISAVRARPRGHPFRGRAASRKYVSRPAGRVVVVVEADHPGTSAARPTISCGRRPSLGPVGGETDVGA